jgi:hypothetical protein
MTRAAGRMATTRKNDINRKVRSSIHQRQNDSEKIRAFDRSPPSNTPHRCAATYGPIDDAQQIAGGHNFLYLLSERYQFATAHRFASFA